MFQFMMKFRRTQLNRRTQTLIRKCLYCVQECVAFKKLTLNLYDISDELDEVYEL